MNETKKIFNLILSVTEVTTGFDEQGRPFEELACQDEQGRWYMIGLDETNYNYQKYKVGDVLYVKSARCFQASATLNFLYYVRTVRTKHLN